VKHEEMGSQVRKSKRQLQSELKTVWLEILCGLLPHQIMEKEKLTQQQFNYYHKKLKQEAGKRFGKLDQNDLALASELYLQTMIRLAGSMDIMIARACTDKEEDDLIDSHLFDVRRQIANDIQTHEERRIGTALGMKWANEKIKETKDKESKDIKISSDNNRGTGVT
jgi:hypothetical protein